MAVRMTRYQGLWSSARCLLGSSRLVEKACPRTPPPASRCLSSSRPCRKKQSEDDEAMEGAHPISRFPIPNKKTLPDDMQDVMNEVEGKSGFLPNVFRGISYHHDIFRSFFGFYDVLMEPSGNLTKADKEMIVVATSAENNCLYCIVAHSALHRVYSKNTTLADQLVANWRVAELDPRQRAIIELAMAVCKNEPITEEHFSNLAAHGLDQEDAFMVGSVAAFFAMSNRFAHLFNLRPNKEFHLLGRVPREKKK